ncbi:disulfide bond formation protein B [Methylophilaceae bacterium]|jgi:protein dithiol:quinone oxidoreductase|nr:disulfide bond formation protein B [Methylophilaceae bacterium]|tara:strand:+ start:1986 stop:2480 length:495 start_codon:yes stop_codon:yes gene_type:complete
MQNFLSFKKINLFGSLLAFILVGLAVAIQAQFNLEPCPLCVTQRIVFIVIGCLFLLFSFFNPSQFIRFFHLSSLLITNIVGIVFAIKHILIQSKWITVPAECGIDLDYMFENFPLTEAFSLLFKGTGDCSEIDWVFLGVTLPQLALIAYIMFGALTFYIYKKIK